MHCHEENPIKCHFGKLMTLQEPAEYLMWTGGTIFRLF